MQNVSYDLVRCDDGIFAKRKDITYHDNGKIFQRILRRDDAKGYTKEVYDSRGWLRSRYECKNGEIHGWFICYRPDGTVAQKTQFRNGWEHGIELVYDLQGKVKTTLQLSPHQVELLRKSPCPVSRSIPQSKKYTCRFQGIEDQW